MRLPLLQSNLEIPTPSQFNHKFKIYKNPKQNEIQKIEKLSFISAYKQFTLNILSTI